MALVLHMSCRTSVSSWRLSACKHMHNNRCIEQTPLGCTNAPYRTQIAITLFCSRCVL